MCRFLTLILVAAGLASAGFAEELADLKLPPATSPKAGYVQGWVVDSAGKPLVGALVSIYGTTMAGQNTRFEVKSAADGHYRQRVPEGIYGVRAEYVTTNAGKKYTMALFPTDGVTSITHDSAEGVAKDFVWLIAGLHPGATPGDEGTHNEPFKYYGGSLQVQFQEEGFSTAQPAPEGSTLIATLTPQGPLFDGRPAKPVQFKRTFTSSVRSSSYWYPSDIPLGRYVLSMQLETPGQGTRALTLKKSLDSNATFTELVPVDVIPNTSSGASLPIQIRVKP